MRRSLFYIIMAIALLAGSIPALGMDQKPGSAVSLKTKGDACYAAGRFSDALEYYTAGMKKAKDDGDDGIYYACLGNIGNIYGGMDDYKRALHYYLKGYDASEKSRNVDMQWRFVTNIVAVYSLMGDARNAKAFFNKQSNIAIKDQTMRRYYFLNNQALVAQAENNAQVAEYYFRQALRFAEERDMPTPYKLSLMVHLGGIQMKAGRTAQAVRFFREAQDSANSAGPHEQLVNIYKCLSDAYKKLGAKDSAQRYRSLYLSLSDSVFNMSQFNMANSKLFEYENEENAKLINTLTSRNYIQLVVIILFLILAAALTLLYMALRHKNRNLLEAQRLLVSKNEAIMKSNAKSKRLLEQYLSMAEAPSNSPRGEEPEVSSAGCGQGLSASVAGVKPEVNVDGEEQGKSQPQSSSTVVAKGGFGLALLDDVQKNKLLNSIITVMEDAEIISKSDFNLNTLAGMVGSNTKYVSWVINDTYNKNFRSLLNEYRISEACKRLSDKEHYGNMTIQAISESVGFNSAASFIQAFKRTNGMTPSLYQRLRNKD